MAAVVERIAVRRLSIGVAMNAEGRVVSTTHVATSAKKVFVVSGRYAVIEVIDQNRITICEVPLGPLGWEYEVL